MKNARELASADSEVLTRREKEIARSYRIARRVIKFQTTSRLSVFVQQNYIAKNLNCSPKDKVNYRVITLVDSPSSPMVILEHGATVCTIRLDKRAQDRLLNYEAKLAS